MIAPILLALVCAAGPRVGGAERVEVYLTEAEALRVAFPGADRVEKKLVAFAKEKREVIARKAGRQAAPGIFRYFVGTRAGETIGYAVIEDCLGKSEPITYLVAIDADRRIRCVEILAYREARGSEVRQSGWREQFVGKRAESPLRVGTDVRNIAGATISCRSVTDGIRLQLACLEAAVPRPSPDAAFAPSAAAPGPGASARRARLAMGTTLEITVHAETDARASEAIDAAFAEVERLEAILSTFRESSEVSRLNRSAGGEFLPASPELLDLLARSRELSRRTHGAFDSATGPLVALWRRAVDGGGWPTDAAIETARALAGIGAIETDPEHGRARLVRAGAALDFGGIGKGYALDRAAAVLESRGIARALLDFGGQVLALDPPPGKVAWRIELRDAKRPESIRGTLELVRASLATTADYERGREIAGRRISHVLDPRTGRPVEGLLGASVLAGTATEADALSTALFVLGPEPGARLAREIGVSVLLVPSDGQEIAAGVFESMRIHSEGAAPSPPPAEPRR
jgi:thiamine biosynthesis lipoprotein